LIGCNAWWDDMTARGYWQERFAPRQDPFVVLKDSRDGDKRHAAVLAIGQVDPATLPPKEAEERLALLITMAGTERQVWVRIAAVQALGNWCDSRAVEGLKDAYYRATAYPGDGGAALRIHVLTALGRCGHPTAMDLLTKVLSEPPEAGPLSEQQAKLEERLAAARALGNFPKSARAGEALLEVLRKENDPGMRNHARESLVSITGRDFPADADVWERFLRDPDSAPEKTLGERFREILPAVFRSDR
jgi:HEAT repeat protein